MTELASIGLFTFFFYFPFWVLPVSFSNIVCVIFHFWVMYLVVGVVGMSSDCCQMFDE